MQTKTFYYQFRKINALLILNILLSILLIKCFSCCPSIIYWPQFQILIAVVAVSFLIWGWLHLIKHKMATVDENGITIDHCRPLAWKDIKNAEEKIVRCCFKKRRVIILNPKENIDYKYNFLQKHNGEFTPFSIPLYHIISPEDAEEITAIIAQKVKLSRLKKTN